MVRISWLWVVCVVMSVFATEHVITLGPALSYTNWKQATNLAPQGDWSSGRYQLSAQIGWYMMVTPSLFTGFYTLRSQDSQVIIGDQGKSISASDTAAIAGLRYQYSQYETRLWWGVNYRDVASSADQLMSNAIWGPTWGVSYGMQSNVYPVSWHWGIIITPGYYNYRCQPSIQVPTRTSAYLALEWKFM